VRDPDTGKRLARLNPCGGGFILASHDLLTCFNARSRGSCSNHRSIRRQEVEGRARRAMKELFFEPGAFAAFCEGFTAEMNLRRREHLAQMAGARRDVAAIDRELRTPSERRPRHSRPALKTTNTVTLPVRPCGDFSTTS
jgi:hypothetical protein